MSVYALGDKQKQQGKFHEMQLSHYSATDSIFNSDCFRQIPSGEHAGLATVFPQRLSHRTEKNLCVHADRKGQFLTALNGW